MLAACPSSSISPQCPVHVWCVVSCEVWCTVWRMSCRDAQCHRRCVMLMTCAVSSVDSLSQNVACCVCSRETVSVLSHQVSLSRRGAVSVGVCSRETVSVLSHRVSRRVCVCVESVCRCPVNCFVVAHVFLSVHCCPPAALLPAGHQSCRHAPSLAVSVYSAVPELPTETASSSLVSSESSH